MTAKRFLITLGIFAILIIGICTYWIVNDIQGANMRKANNAYIDKLFAEKEQKEQRQIDSDPALPVDTSSEKPTETTNTNKSTDESTNVNTSDINQSVPITPLTYKLKDGIYKGMSYADAYIAWEAKKNEVLDRFLESSREARRLARIQVGNVKDEMSLMLSMLKRMSPEDLALTKEATLHFYPDKADEIEAFFNNVQNNGTKLSDKEIIEKADFILESRELNRIATKQNSAEFDAIWEELQQVNKERPKRPPLP